MEFISDIESSLKRLSSRASKRSIEGLQKVQMTEHLFMIVAAVIIGILGGFGGVGIRVIIKAVSDISYYGDGTILHRIIEAPWYWKILVPTVGGLVVGPIIYFFAPEAKGHGVPEVMQAILMEGGHIRPRVAVIKALASSITIGTGGSVGREGPIIQIGSSLGSTVGQFFRVSSRRMKILVGCGSAAGIAAAFNAPVAGALFAVEIILMDFGFAIFSPIVISSVIATVISHFFEGDIAAFQITALYHLRSPWEIIFYFILGGLSGVVSWMFIKSLYYFENVWDYKIKLPEYSKAMFGGLSIGLIALVFPQVMGVGYETISAALNGTLDFTGEAIWLIPLVLIFVKILATSLTLASGGSGGIFAPSLYMGAMLGAAFGFLVDFLFPHITAEPGAYALVAMAGLIAGTTRAPMTAIIIVFEMTKDYDVIMPVMIVCVISMILSSKLSRESIYTLKLVQRGIKIKERAEVNILKSISTKDVYSKEFTSIKENTPFDEIVKNVISKRLPYLFVESMEGKFMGVISIHHVKDLLFEKDILRNVVIAGDIADKKISRVSINEDCKAVLDKMAICNYDGLPVFGEGATENQIGVIWRKDINDRYSDEIDRHELTSGLANKITMSNAGQDVTFVEGYVLSEIPAPKLFMGNTIRGLDIRAKYGVDIISINSKTKGGNKTKAIPQADYTFMNGDTLVVAGKTENINKLKNLK